MNSRIGRLPTTVTAPRTDPIYNCHGYLTKVPIAAIYPFIDVFTRPGETVLDPFAGSGMTGLAALQSGRKALLSDISVLGRHIARGYLTQVQAEALRAEANRVQETARRGLGELYTTIRASDGAGVEMVRTVWSFVYECPACGTELVYYEHLSPSGSPPNECPCCGVPFSRRKWPRLRDTPVSVVVRGTDGLLKEQSVSSFDREMIVRASGDQRLGQVPSLTIDESREMFSRSGLRRAGIANTAAFFSPRNAVALLEMWNAINAVQSADVRRKLRFAFTAILPRASRRYQWSPKRPLNAQNQTYYIAPVHYEWNVFELFARKVEAAIRADEALSAGGSPFAASAYDVEYVLASADDLSHVADESVDYVFTDPPFGSNIYYSDMSLFHEAWIGEVTDHAAEAVVRTTAGQRSNSASRYEALLGAAFAEAYRVLKPGRHMSVVFGNSSGRVWGLVQRAIRDAGFGVVPVHVAVLDKGQRSVKGLNSGTESVVTVDLILTAQKPLTAGHAGTMRQLEHGDAERLIRESIRELGATDAKNPSHVYARVLSRAVQQQFKLDDLHLGDVLVALRNAGYGIDAKTGLLLHERA